MLNAAIESHRTPHSALSKFLAWLEVKARHKASELRQDSMSSVLNSFGVSNAEHFLISNKAAINAHGWEVRSEGKEFMVNGEIAQRFEITLVNKERRR